MRAVDGESFFHTDWSFAKIRPTPYNQMWFRQRYCPLNAILTRIGGLFNGNIGRIHLAVGSGHDSIVRGVA